MPTEADQIQRDRPSWSADEVAKQVELGLDATTETLVSAAEAWHALLTMNVDLVNAAQRGVGSFLIDWHQRIWPESR